MLFRLSLQYPFLDRSRYPIFPFPSIFLWLALLSSFLPSFLLSFLLPLFFTLPLESRSGIWINNDIMKLNWKHGETTVVSAFNLGFKSRPEMYD